MNSNQIKIRTALCALLTTAWILGTSIGLRPVAAQEAAATKVTFDDHAAAIFKKRCSSCHNPDKRSGDLDVTNYTNFMQGGGSGQSIEPGDASSSYLYSLILHEDSPEMPPGAKIPDAEIKVIADWINGGALENVNSKAVIKPKFDLSMSGSPTEKPEVAPLPARIPLEPVVRTPRSGTVPTIATSPWAPIAAIAGQKQVLLYNTNDLNLVGVLPNGGGQSKALRFSRNGNFLISSGGLEGDGAKIQVWNIRTGEQLTTIGDELDTILAADISPDHSLVALGGPQKTVRVYSTADGSLKYEITKHTDWVTALEFSPDGEYLASGDRNGGLFIWMVPTGDEHLNLKAHSKMISGVSWRLDSKVVASASEDTTVRLWEIENGKQVKNWGAHGGGVTSIEFTRDGRIATAGRDKVAKLWQQDGKMLQQYGGLPDLAVAVSFCDETNRIICSDWTGLVRAWNSADAAHVGDLDANPPLLADRLAAVQATAGEARARHQPLAAQVATTEKAVADQAALLKTAKETMTQAQTMFDGLQPKIKAHQQQLASTKAEQDAWRGELASITKALPSIQASHAKAAEALAALPNDEQLKQTSATLQAKSKQVEARQAELNNLVAQSDQKKATTEKQLADMVAQSTQAKQNLDKSTAEVAELDKKIGMLNDQLAKEREAMNAAQAQIAQADAQVKHWQDEINFVNVLTELKTQMVAAGEVVNQKQLVVGEAEQKLAAAQAEVDAARAAQNQAESALNELKVKMDQLRGIDGIQ